MSLKSAYTGSPLGLVTVTVVTWEQDGAPTGALVDADRGWDDASGEAFRFSGSELMMEASMSLARFETLRSDAPLRPHWNPVWNATMLSWHKMKPSLVPSVHIPTRLSKFELQGRLTLKDVII